MSKRSVLATIVLAVALGAASVANAGFFLTAPLDPFTGNSQFITALTPEETISSDGLVNFGVYQNTDGNWADDTFNIGGSNFTIPSGAVNYLLGSGANARYVYMYQLVNTDPFTPDDALEHLQVALGTTGVVSGLGYITNTVFYDNSIGSAGPTTASGPNGSTSNRLGFAVGNTLLPGDAVGLTPSENLTVVDAPGLTTQGAAIEPTSYTLIGGLATLATANNIQFDFGSMIPTGGWSSIVFITSNSAPVYKTSFVRDTGATANEIPSVGGPVGPSPTPEPTNLVMLGGVLVCGLVALMKYGKSSQVSTN